MNEVFMAMPVLLSNGRRWKSQKDAFAHFRAILTRYRAGQVINSTADHQDLMALVESYDRDLPGGAETKMGAGITHFSKDHAGGNGYSTDCFFAHRQDGSVIDFSYIQAVRSASKV